MRAELTVILGCGSHKAVNVPYVRTVMDGYLFTYGKVMVITGAAKNTDRVIEDWARDREQIYVGIPAEWKVFGKAAGMKRNKEMPELIRPNFIVAFPGGRGTQGMVDHADRLGIPVHKWGWENL